MKKYFVLLLAALLVLSAFAGCNSNSDSKKTGDAPKETQSAAPTEAPTDEPTAAPTEAPTDEPTAVPTEAPTDEPTAVPTEAADPTVYAKGRIENGVYINEWADLRYVLTAKLPEGTREEYMTYENAETECGLLCSDMNAGRQLAVTFEKLSGENSAITASEYIEIASSAMETLYKALNITVNCSKPFDYTIGGREYTAASCVLNDGAVYQYYCARKVDGYVIVIIVTALDEETIKSDLFAFTSANT